MPTGTIRCKSKNANIPLSVNNITMVTYDGSHLPSPCSDHLKIIQLKHKQHKKYVHNDLDTCLVDVK